MLLVKAGVDVNISENSGPTPLSRAALNGNLEIVKFLLHMKANVNHTSDTEYGPPLHVAVKCRHLDITKLLLESSADPNTPDGIGLTPLHYAIDRNSVECAIMLLEYGASPSCRDSCGRTPLDLLRRCDSAPLLYQIPIFKDMARTSRAYQVFETRKSIQHILCRLEESMITISALLWKLQLSTRQLGNLKAVEMTLLQKGRYDNEIWKFKFSGTCDQCSGDLYDVMHICKIFIDTYLCRECRPKYENENPIDWCIGHDYLEIKARSPYTDEGYDSATSLRTLIEYVRANCLKDFPSQNEA